MRVYAYQILEVFVQLEIHPYFAHVIQQKAWDRDSVL